MNKKATNKGATAMQTTDRTVATTIARQIGTDALLAVSGRDYTMTHNSLSFAYGPKGGAWRRINIVLEANDTYSMEATRTTSRGRNFGRSTVTAHYEGVYADQLGFLVRDINNNQ